jgi:hypothetical protein
LLGLYESFFTPPRRPNNHYPCRRSMCYQSNFYVIRFLACGSMVLPIVSVSQFVPSTSAQTETQKKITYRTAEGGIADCEGRII